MADVIANALDWLNGMLRDHASQTVTYFNASSFGGGSSVDIQAVFGSPVSQPTSILSWQPNETDLLQPNAVNTPRVFSVLASDLVINGQTILPATGDYIQQTTPDGVTSQYEVMAPQSGGLIWEYETGHRGAQARISIYTKFTEVVL